MDTRPALLQLRLRGKILNPHDEESARLVTIGHASERGEHLILTPGGRSTADVEFRLTDSEPVQLAYEQFVARNAELLRICHDWQVRSGNHPNDHADATYDWSVIDRLSIVDDRIGPVVRRLGRTQAPFDGYRPRLRAARTKVEDGEHDWFTSPRIDSYHTVWMELHEHLLVGLGLERGSETVDT